MNTRTPRTRLVLDEDTQTWIGDLHAGLPNAYVMFQGMDTKGVSWHRAGQPVQFAKNVIVEETRFFGINPVCQIVTDIDREKKPGKTDAEIAPWVAAKDATVAGINCLIADIDGKDFVNPPDSAVEAEFKKLRADKANDEIRDKGLLTTARGNVISAIFKANRETYLSLARAYVDALEPTPSYVVFTGGGYQCEWLLKETFVIRETIDEESTHVFSYVQNVLKRWVQHFPKADQKVADPRRVFRLVGSRNMKPSYAPDFPLVAFYKINRDLRYDLKDLVGLLAPVVEPEVTRPAHKPSRLAVAAQTGNGETINQEDSVISTFNINVNIEEILVAEGYKKVGDRYLRPGGKDTPGVTIDRVGNRSQHWSSNDDLCDPHWRRPFDVLCILRHNGNVRAAVRDAAEQMGMVRKSPVALATIASVMEYTMTHNIGDLLPGKGQRKIRPVLMDILAKMKERETSTVTFGAATIAKDSGVSRNTVMNVLVLLQDKILNSRNTETYGIEITLLSANRLAQLDPAIVGTQCAADYAEYETALNLDAFTTGTSKFKDREIRGIVQRCQAQGDEEMTYPIARELFTKAGLGEGVLYARQVSLRLGDMTAQELHEHTGVKIAFARKQLNTAVKMGLADVEREGPRGPKIYTFHADFWDKIIELMPVMRTYKISEERYNKMLLSQQEHIARSIRMARTDIEKVNLRTRMEHLGRKRLPLLRSIYADLGKTEKELRLLAFDVVEKAKPQWKVIAFENKHAEVRAEHRQQKRAEKERMTTAIYKDIEDMKANKMRFKDISRYLSMAGYTPNDIKPAMNQLFPFKQTYAPGVMATT
jgi:hypothetical protein